MIDNYLKAWDAIIERVRSEMPELADVLSAPDIAVIREDQQRTPNVQVLYDGDIVDGGEGGSAGRGAAQVVLQRFVLWVVVKNVRRAERMKDAFDEVGPLVSKVIAALAGWAPAAEFRPMRRTNALKPAYSPGFVYVPIAFQTQLITTP